ncbi:hypothetical protein [Haloarcula sp. JP-L23]
MTAGSRTATDEIMIEYDPEKTDRDEIAEYISESFHHVDYIEVDL